MNARRERARAPYVVEQVGRADDRDDARDPAQFGGEARDLVEPARAEEVRLRPGRDELERREPDAEPLDRFDPGPHRVLRREIVQDVARHR